MNILGRYKRWNGCGIGGEGGFEGDPRCQVLTGGRGRGKTQEEGLLGWERGSSHRSHCIWGAGGCASGHNPGNSYLELKNVVSAEGEDLDVGSIGVIWNVKSFSFLNHLKKGLGYRFHGWGRANGCFLVFEWLVPIPLGSLRFQERSTLTLSSFTEHSFISSPSVVQLLILQTTVGEGECGPTQQLCVGNQESIQIKDTVWVQLLPRWMCVCEREKERERESAWLSMEWVKIAGQTSFNGGKWNIL